MNFLQVFPREVRNEIYHHALVGTFYKFVDGKVLFYTKYKAESDSGSYRKRPDCYKWMITCQQIRHEAIEQFYMHAVCYHFHSANTRAIVYQSPFTVHKIRDFDLSFRLRHWTQYRRKPVLCQLIIDTRDKWERFDRIALTGGADDVVLEYSDEEDWGTGELVDVLATRKNDNVRSLKLTLEFTDLELLKRTPEFDRVEMWSANFSFLGLFGTKIKKVEFQLEPVLVIATQNEVRTREMFMLLLQQELVKCGKGMVCGPDETGKKGGWTVGEWKITRTHGQMSLEIRRNDNGEEIGKGEPVGLLEWIPVEAFRENLGVYYSKLADQRDDWTRYVHSSAVSVFTIPKVTLPEPTPLQ